MSDSRKEVPVGTNETVHYHGSAESGVRVSGVACGEVPLTREAIQSLVATLRNWNPLLIHPRGPDATMESTVVRVLTDPAETPLEWRLCETDARKVFAVLLGEGIVSRNGREFGPAIDDHPDDTGIAYLKALEGRCGIFCERGLVASVTIASVSISRTSDSDEIYCQLPLEMTTEGALSHSDVREPFEVGSRIHAGMIGTGSIACPYVGWRLYTAAQIVNDVLEYSRQYPDKRIGPKDVRAIIGGGGGSPRSG